MKTPKLTATGVKDITQADIARTALGAYTPGITANPLGATDIARRAAGAYTAPGITANPLGAADIVATPVPDLEKSSGSRNPSAVINSPNELGRLVRRVREKRNLSQQSFADLAGVGRRFLSELENGKATIEFGKVLNVVRAAGITLFANER